MMKILKRVNCLLIGLCFLYLLLSSNAGAYLPGKAIKDFFLYISDFIHVNSVTFSIVFLFIAIIMLTLHFICIKSENDDLSEKYEVMKTSQHASMNHLSKRMSEISEEITRIDWAVHSARCSINHTSSTIFLKADNILLKASTALTNIKNSYFTTSKHLYNIFLKSYEDTTNELKAIVKDFINNN